MLDLSKETETVKQMEENWGYDVNSGKKEEPLEKNNNKRRRRKNKSKDSTSDNTYRKYLGVKEEEQDEEKGQGIRRQRQGYRNGQLRVRFSWR